MMAFRYWLLFSCIAFASAGARAQACKKTSFLDTVTSQENFSHPFAPGLSFRLEALRDEWGWVISIGDEDWNEDWTYPVTMPIRTGEQQVIGTGYGVTVQEKMKQPTVVEFVLNHTDFVEYSKLAKETLDSSRPEAATEYADKIAKLAQGHVTVTPLGYGKGETAETIKWMKFKVSIVVPVTFQSALVSWTPTPCPSQ